MFEHITAIIGTAVPMAAPMVVSIIPLVCLVSIGVDIVQVSAEFVRNLAGAVAAVSVTVTYITYIRLLIFCTTRPR